MKTTYPESASASCQNDCSAGPESGLSISKPSAGATVSSKRRRRLVSVVLDPDSPEIFDGIVRAARELRWDLVIGNAPQERQFDGVLSTTNADDLWHWTRGLECPVVRMLSTVVSSASAMPSDDMPTVALDLNAAGEIAARHLISLGMPNVAFFRNYGSEGPSALMRSFSESCRFAGKDVIVIDAVSEKPSDRQAWLKERLSRLPLPCAVMADHDRFGMEVIEVASGLGMRVPEDLAVLGIENAPAVQKRSVVPLSSVDMNLELMGYAGARLLEKAMKGEDIEPKHHLIPPNRVSERKSTATYVCDSPGISKAIVKIRGNYHRPISIKAMAKECGLSIRSLYRLYRATTGNTIGQDIMTLRIEAAAEMLRNENLKLEPIAIETGLGNAKNLCRLFKEHYGLTPGQWRATRNPLAVLQ